MLELFDRRFPGRPIPLMVLLAMMSILIESQASEPPPEWSDLIESIEEIRLREGIASVGVTLVDEDGILWTGGLGTIAHDSDEPFGPDTLIRIGSITKTFTSLVALQAAEAGHLALDDEISRWVPSGLYSNPWEAEDPIRVAHLLEHTAGFRGLSRFEFHYSEPEELTPVEALSLTPDTHVASWRPGEHSSYTNLGAGFAWQVLEASTGKSFEALVSEGVFEPLGMVRSGMRGDADTLAELATGYDSDATSILPYWHMLFPPFGAINTTPREMAAFIRMLINRGEYDGSRLVSRESIGRMEYPGTTLGSRYGLDYGYGLGNYQWYNEGRMFHGHGGDADGYLSHFGYSRDNNLGYFIVITAFKKPVLLEMRDLIEKRIIRDLPEPDWQPASVVQESVLESYTGRYENITTRFNRPVSDNARASRRPENRMVISLEEGRLYTRINDGKRFELIPITETLFRRSYRPRPTSVLMPLADGSIIYQDSQYNFRRPPPD